MLLELALIRRAACRMSPTMKLCNRGILDLGVDVGPEFGTDRIERTDVYLAAEQLF
jgi:hypothetical protein